MMIIVPNISGAIGTMIKDSGSHFSSTNMFDLKIHFRINDQEIYIVRKHEKIDQTTVHVSRNRGFSEIWQ